MKSTGERVGFFLTQVPAATGWKDNCANSRADRARRASGEERVSPRHPPAALGVGSGQLDNLEGRVLHYFHPFM